jgi:hypothetical protein
VGGRPSPAMTHVNLSPYVPAHTLVYPAYFPG